MQVKVTFFNANFRHIPANSKKPDRKPYAVIEFMGGSQLVENSALFPQTEMADEVICEASYMGQQLRIDGVLDVRKGGKSVVKELKVS